MEIIFHARGAVLAEDFREIASEKLKSLERFSVPVDGVKVEIKHEQNPHFGKSSHLVTLTSHGSGPFVRAEGQAFNDTAAFDVAVDNVDRVEVLEALRRACRIGGKSAPVFRW